MQELLDQIDVGEDHSSTTISFQPDSVQRITIRLIASVPRPSSESRATRGRADPSVWPESRSCRYCVQRSPTTFPHEKQRTGMIYDVIGVSWNVQAGETSDLPFRTKTAKTKGEKCEIWSLVQFELFSSVPARESMYSSPSDRITSDSFRKNRLPERLRYSRRPRTLRGMRKSESQ